MRWFSAVALVCGVIVLGVPAWMWQQADALAEAAIQRREKALVDKYRPAVVRICRDFRISEPPEDVQTVDELLTPIGRLFEGLRK